MQFGFLCENESLLQVVIEWGGWVGVLESKSNFNKDIYLLALI